jgi:hypothetical protein
MQIVTGLTNWRHSPPNPSVHEVIQEVTESTRPDVMPFAISCPKLDRGSPMQHRTHGNFHDDGDIQCGTLEKKGVSGQALASVVSNK